MARWRPASGAAAAAGRRRAVSASKRGSKVVALPWSVAAGGFRCRHAGRGAGRGKTAALPHARAASSCPTPPAANAGSPGGLLGDQQSLQPLQAALLSKGLGWAEPRSPGQLERWPGSRKVASSWLNTGEGSRECSRAACWIPACISATTTRSTVGVCSNRRQAEHGVTSSQARPAGQRLLPIRWRRAAAPA